MKVIFNDLYNIWDIYAGNETKSTDTFSLNLQIIPVDLVADISWPSFLTDQCNWPSFLRDKYNWPSFLTVGYTAISWLLTDTVWLLGGGIIHCHVSHSSAGFTCRLPLLVLIGALFTSDTCSRHTISSVALQTRCCK